MLARWVAPREEVTTRKSVIKNSDFGPAFIYNKFHFYNKQNNYGIGILNWQHVGGKTCNNSCTDICNLLQSALVLIFAINCNQFLYWYLQWPMYWYWWRVLKCVGLIHRRESCESVIHSGTWSRNTFSVLWLTSAVPSSRDVCCSPRCSMYLFLASIESIRPVGQLYNSPLSLSGPMMFVYELSIQITSV